MRGKALLLEERELILRGICEKLSDRAIGRRIGKNQSVISREIANNGGRDRYSPSAAQERAELLKARPKARKLVANKWLHDAVAAGLSFDCSPEQIAGRLKQQYPDEPDKHVSHETIYQTLYVQARGELTTELRLALRTGRVHRVPRGSSRPKQARIKDMVNISERAAEAADRAVPGHWEGGSGDRQGRQIASRHLGGTAFPIRDDRPSSLRPMCRPSRQGVVRAYRFPPRRIAPVAHLGSGCRTGRPRVVHRRHQRARLLLRSTLAMATRQQREHQRSHPP